jgi:hypothetical protein
MSRMAALAIGAAATMPTRQPTATSKPLSTKTCRTNRTRPAPSEARKASSRCRTVDRASSKLVTLTQQINRVDSASPCKRMIGVGSRPCRALRSAGSSKMRRSGCSVRSACVVAVVAAARVAPARSVPTTFSHHMVLVFSADRFGENAASS